MGLCPARNDGTLARSHPPRIRLRWTSHPDVCHGLWHHVRCRESQICGLRPGPDAGKPQAARKLLGLSLFLRTPTDQLHSGTRATHAERRAGCRRRNSTRLRPRLGEPALTRGRLLDRRCHAVPRRNNERVRQRIGAALCAGSYCRAPRPQPRIQRLCWKRQYRKSLPLQSGFQERIQHGSQCHCDNIGSDPGNHGDHRCRPRGGDGLDRQFSAPRPSANSNSSWANRSRMSPSGCWRSS